MEEIYANVESVKPLNSRSSAKPEGPRSSERFLQAAVLCLGLLSLFLLAGLIGLAVRYHNSVGGAAADLSSVKANLTERLQASDQQLSSVSEERDRLNASLTEKTKEVARLQSSNKTCPAGWRKFSCVCYLISTERASWERSRQNCRASGADLVIVDSYKEQEFITSMIKEQTWIGLNDIGQEGTWKWVDGTPLTQKYWGLPPDNGSGDPVWGEEDCASLVNGRETSKNWNDLSCTSPLQWICEKIIDVIAFQKFFCVSSLVFSLCSDLRRSGRRFLRAAVIGLGLLSVFLLAGLIGLAVCYHDSRFSCPTEERDRLNASLIEMKRFCPAGWRMFSSTCYHLSKATGSWEKGREECRDTGADLVVIDSAEEQTFLSNFTGGETTAWIGLTDKVEEKTWLWINGAPLSIQYWRSIQPDNGGGYKELGEEDCAHIITGGQNLKNWNDLSCKTSLQWICEKVLPSVA
ncbi:uncharacterized protein LOC134867414 [Eleginops maclovinus]|uniref:uncharacterized protein LOC134867414 n=1 Tax=Eleginops maclovinus TaxID=56733 RepID=UPI003080A8D5